MALVSSGNGDRPRRGMSDAVLGYPCRSRMECGNVNHRYDSTGVLHQRTRSRSVPKGCGQTDRNTATCRTTQTRASWCLLCEDGNQATLYAREVFVLGQAQTIQTLQLSLIPKPAASKSEYSLQI
jgi:hypothetical protein